MIVYRVAIHAGEDSVFTGEESYYFLRQREAFAFVDGPLEKERRRLLDEGTQDVPYPRFIARLELVRAKKPELVIKLLNRRFARNARMVRDYTVNPIER